MNRPRLSFRCPLCNTHEFGSSEGSEGLTRTCHGSVYDARSQSWRGCSFRWPQADDWKHFVTHFPDRSSYAAAERRERELLSLGQRGKA